MRNIPTRPAEFRSRAGAVLRYLPPAGTLCISLTLLLLCTVIQAGAQGYAPQFSVQGLDGGSITNNSLSGNVVLLQFWATWCHYCRGDQPAVEHVARTFADQGLTVLAVDVGESPETVRAYLRSNPRSCQIAVDQDSSMAAQFGSHGFPHYVLIDRNGKIAGVLNGAGGENGLRQLITRSKVFSNTDSFTASYKAEPPPSYKTHSGGSYKAPARIGPSKVVEVPLVSSAPPSKPLPKTVFYFTSGQQLETDHYLLRPGVLEVTVNGEQHQIPFSDLDLKKTVSVNHERGVDLKIPANSNEVFLAF